MNSIDFIEGLKFIATPFIGLLIITVFLSILSVLIAFKRESIVAIVYPQTVQALLAIFSLILAELSIWNVGLKKLHETHSSICSIGIFIGATLTLFFLHFFLFRFKWRFLKKNKSHDQTQQDQQYFLFCLLIVSITISLFLTYLSSDGDYSNRLLYGEMLAFSLKELWVVIALVSSFLLLFLRRSKNLLSYALDQQYYNIHSSTEKKIISGSYYFFLILGISLSAFYFGSLFTMAVLILPPFFYWENTRSLKNYFWLLIINNFLAIMGGIFSALLFNLPPVIMIVFVFVGLGIIVRIGKRFIL